MNPEKAAVPDDSFDLLRNDLLLRWQRKLRIAPQQGLGVVRFFRPVNVAADHDLGSPQ